MASGISVMVKALNIKEMHVNSVEYSHGVTQHDGAQRQRDYIDLHVRPYKRIRCQCPECRKRCAVYDHKDDHEVFWRAGLHLVSACTDSMP